MLTSFLHTKHWNGSTHCQPWQLWYRHADARCKTLTAAWTSWVVPPAAASAAQEARRCKLPSATSSVMFQRSSKPALGPKMSGVANQHPKYPKRNKNKHLTVLRLACQLSALSPMLSFRLVASGVSNWKAFTYTWRGLWCATQSTSFHFFLNICEPRMVQLRSNAHITCTPSRILATWPSPSWSTRHPHHRLHLHVWPRQWAGSDLRGRSWRDLRGFAFPRGNYEIYI